MTQHAKGMDHWDYNDHHDAAELHDKMGDVGHANIAKMHRGHAAKLTAAIDKIMGSRPPKAPKKKDIKKSTEGEGSRGGHITGHTKSGHPIYGHADQSKISADVQKKWTTGVKAYLKHHEAARNGDSDAMEKLKGKHDKLYKIANDVDDQQTREHLFNHMEGKHEGALPTKAEAREKHDAYKKDLSAARVSRAETVERESKHKGDGHYATAARQHEAELRIHGSGFKKSLNVTKIG